MGNTFPDPTFGGILPNMTSSGLNQILKNYIVIPPPGSETVFVPSAPSGPAAGNIGQTYTYSTGGSYSNLGHPIQYRFDWGDGTFSDWSSSTNASKSWSTPNSYLIKAQARCATDTSVVSSWSSGLTVNITESIILQSPSNDEHFNACSLYSLPTFSWTATEAFKGYQLQFSPDTCLQCPN